MKVLKKYINPNLEVEVVKIDKVLTAYPQSAPGIFNPFNLSTTSTEESEDPYSNDSFVGKTITGDSPF